MPRFKNISRREVSIIYGGKKLNISPGEIINGPNMFSMYKDLKIINEKEFEKYEKAVGDVMKYNSVEANKLKKISNNFNVETRRPLESNITNVIKIKKYVDIVENNEKPSVAILLYGQKNNSNEIKKNVSYDNIKIYFNKYENLDELSEDYIIKQSSEIKIKNDYISEIVKLSVISSVNIPKIYEVSEADKKWIRNDIIKNYTQKTECYLSIVSLVNNKRQYQNFLDDLLNQYTTHKFEVIVAPNFNNIFSSCSEALNILRDVSSGQVINYCHQDLKCPNTWIHGIITHVKQLNARKEKWGVLGMAGAYLNSTPRNEYNVLYLGDSNSSNNFSATYRRMYGNKREVQCVDELSLITERNDNIRFDESFNHFHFYGADLCLQYMSRGYKNYAIDAQCIHLSDGQGNMKCHRDKFIEHSVKLYKKWRNVFKSWKTTTANFEVDKKIIIPLIFIIINSRNKNKDLPTIISIRD